MRVRRSGRAGILRVRGAGSHTAPEPIVVHSGSCPSDTKSEHVAIGRETRVDKAGLPHAAPAGEKAHVEDTRTGRVSPTRETPGGRGNADLGAGGEDEGIRDRPRQDFSASQIVTLMLQTRAWELRGSPPTPKSHSDAVTEVKPQHGSLRWGWWEGAQPAHETAVGMISKGMFIIFLLRPGKVT